MPWFDVSGGQLIMNSALVNFQIDNLNHNPRVYLAGDGHTTMIPSNTRVADIFAEYAEDGRLYAHVETWPSPAAVNALPARFRNNMGGGHTIGWELDFYRSAHPIMVELLACDGSAAHLRYSARELQTLVGLSYIVDRDLPAMV
jgi:hypothetical protein